VVGLPFYGRLFPAATRYEPLDLSKKEQHRALSYQQIRQLLDQKPKAGRKWKATWDKEVQAPWIGAPGGKGPIVAYDDRNSIYKKTVWARRGGYRGLFFWAIHQDRMPDGKHWLLEASYKAWPGHPAETSP